MGLVQWLFQDRGSAGKSGRKSTNSQTFQASTQFHASHNSRNPSGAQHADHRDLLRVVLRETLARNGIPLPWVSADALAATSSSRPPGVHVRMLIKQWDPRLLHHSMAFQQDFEKRLTAMDPLAHTWLMGISWQYALPNPDVCPPLPHPDAWLEAPETPATVPVPLAAAALAQQATPLGGNADVIAGPVRIAEQTPGRTHVPGEASADARADLEALLAIRDADMQNHAAQGGTFAATEPSPL